MTCLAIISLLVICVICAWGPFTEAFHDNLLQRCGMIVTLFGCLSTMVILWKREYTSPSELTLLIGVTLFAIGTAARVYNKRRKEKHGQFRYRENHS